MEGALARLRAREVPIRGVIDVGAAMGRWSQKALRHFPEADYLLVEPLEERRAALEAFCAAHPKAAFTIAAAGESEGEVSFNVSPDLDGSGVYSDRRGTLRNVPLTTIDAEVHRRQLRPPYLLKLDTHGFEIPILAGARETLSQTSALLMEGYNFQLSPGCLRFHELCAQVEPLGFRCAELVDLMLRPGDALLWQLDVLFLRKDSSFFTHTGYQAPTQIIRPHS
jgi:FkbM family methyltransferase